MEEGDKAKKCQQPLATEKGKDMDSSPEPGKEGSPADTLIDPQQSRGEAQGSSLLWGFRVTVPNNPLAGEVRVADTMSLCHVLMTSVTHSCSGTYQGPLCLKEKSR